jgi:hypothetical protein
MCAQTFQNGLGDPHMSPAIDCEEPVGKNLLYRAR